MKKRIMAALLALSMLVAGLGGCSSKEQDASTDTGKAYEENDSSSSRIAVSEDFEISEEDEAIYESLFDINSEVRISIDISEDELAKIQSDYEHYSSFNSKSPIYRMCTLNIEIDGETYTIPEVGIRMKGNTSRCSFYDENDDEVYNLIHFKISFTETFDNEEYYGDDAKVWESDEARQERKNRTFASLEGLELKWNHDLDGTYIRDTYAYKMYRDFGVLAPDNTLGALTVNDQSWGVYKVYEPVDKIFIARYFDEEDQGGDLYKCAWAGRNNASYTKVNGMAGIEDEDTATFYPYDLKTNKKTSNHESLTKLISTMKDTNSSKEDIEDVLDTDNWLRFMAVSYFLGMPDDLRNNYNNHYVYFKGSTGQAVFIAYDCEICLGINSWNPTGDYMTSTNPYSGWAYGNNSNQVNPLVKRTVADGGLYTEEYTEILDKVAGSKWLNINTYQVMYGALAYKYVNDTDIDFDARDFDERLLEMSVYDMYNDGQDYNANMSVELYFERMRENYYQHKE